MRSRFVDECCNPVTPALFAPRDVDFRAVIPDWLYRQFGPGSVHVQETCYADNTPGAPVEFDPLQNRKYNAEVYFKHADNRATVPPGSQADRVTVLQKYQMSEPPRNQHAQRAYDEFIRGLEVVGAQEHMIHGAGNIDHMDEIPEEDQAAMLEDLRKHLNFAGSHAPDEADLLRNLAAWERYKKLRADAPLRRRWYYSLKKRACSTSKDEFSRAPPKSYPRIRKGTFQLLTRPAERDFDFVKYLLRLFTVVSMSYAFYAQINAITRLCPDAYMCPMNMGIWPHRPAAAPPVDFRVKGDFTMSLDYDYYHRVGASCLIGSAGCKTPGYRIQWPYMQLTPSDTAAEGSRKLQIGVPAAIQASCEQQRRGSTGWMWDYSTSHLLQEYWDCGSQGVIQFEDSDGVPFHFETDWYKAAQKTTAACMKKALGTSDPALWERADWSVIAVSDVMEHCFYQEMELATSSSLLQGNIALCRCRSNAVAWTLPQVDEDDLARHQLFGCWFDALDAESQIFAEYHACTFLPQRSVFQARPNRLNQTLNDVKNKIIRDSVTAPVASRKTAALTFFLFKESGPITAALVMPLVVLIYLLALPAFGLVQMFVPRSMRVETNLCASTLALHLLWDIVHTFWSLCVRMSNIFNVYTGLSVLFFSTQVNNSLYRDGMDAIAMAFNIFFNLVCQVFSDLSFAEGAILWASILVSILNLIILIMSTMYQAELLKCLMKDLNENRLSTFEVALGLVKMIEDFVEDDVQYNFIQQFRTPGPVFSEESLRNESTPTPAEGGAETRYTDETHTYLVRTGFGCSCAADDEALVEEHQFYPTIPHALVEKFGDDGLTSSWFSEECPAVQGRIAQNGGGQKPLSSGAAPAPSLLQVQQQPQVQQPLPRLPQSLNPMPPYPLPWPTGQLNGNSSRGQSMATIVFPDFPPQNAADGSISFPVFPTRNTPSCEAAPLSGAAHQEGPPSVGVEVLRQPPAAVSMSQPEPLMWSSGELSQC